jgi:hypothetical protein
MSEIIDERGLMNDNLKHLYLRDDHSLFTIHYSLLITPDSFVVRHVGKSLLKLADGESKFSAPGY